MSPTMEWTSVAAYHRTSFPAKRKITEPFTPKYIRSNAMDGMRDKIRCSPEDGSVAVSDNDTSNGQLTGHDTSRGKHVE